MTTRALVWTRALQDFAADAVVLAAAAPAAHVLHMPCVAFEARRAAPKLERYDYAVVSSAHAAAFVASDPLLRRIVASAQAVYTHGATTAEALQRHGFAATLVGSVSTAEQLCAWLGKALPQGASVALPVPAEPAFDLDAGLTALGLRPETLVCYATTAAARDEAGRAFSPEARDALVRSLSGVVCFASPSAVVGFASVLTPATNRLGRALIAVVIGPTTAQAARPHFVTVHPATEASVPALAAAAALLT